MPRNNVPLSGKVLAEVIEKLAFMIAEPAGVEDVPPLESSALRVDIGFTGPQEGRLMLVVPIEVARVIATNVLGIDPGEELPPTGAEDATKELANVLCGQFLTALAGSEPVFNMTVPEATPIEPEAWDAILAEPDVMAFQVDYEYPLLLRAEVR